MASTYRRRFGRRSRTCKSADLVDLLVYTLDLVNDQDMKLGHPKRRIHFQSRTKNLMADSAAKILGEIGHETFHLALFEKNYTHRA